MPHMQIYAHLKQYYVPPTSLNNWYKLLMNLVAAPEIVKTAFPAPNRGQISFSQSYLSFWKTSKPLISSRYQAKSLWGQPDQQNGVDRMIKIMHHILYTLLSNTNTLNTSSKIKSSCLILCNLLYFFSFMLHLILIYSQIRFIDR